jgi:hypothetical protein
MATEFNKILSGVSLWNGDHTDVARMQGSSLTPLYHGNYFRFDVQVTVHGEKFLLVKPTRCTNLSNLFL